MLEKEYILTERELYKKVSPGIYELYFGPFVQKKIKDEITPVILKSEEKQHQNLIYKDADIMIFGLIDPTIIYRLKNNNKLEFKDKVSRMYISSYHYNNEDENRRKRCIFLKLDISDEFEDDLYCVYPFGNTWIETKKICIGNIPLSIDGFEWLEVPSNNEIKIIAISDYLTNTDFDSYLPPLNKENKKLISKNLNNYWIQQYRIILEIYDNYEQYFKLDDKNIRLYEKSDYFYLLKNNDNIRKTLINWYILNILIPKYKNDPKFISIIKKRPFILTWKEVIKDE